MTFCNKPSAKEDKGVTEKYNVKLLFIWAILSNRAELARTFWHHLKVSINKKR